jgi:hypothetical protein
MTSMYTMRSIVRYGVAMFKPFAAPALDSCKESAYERNGVR